MSTPELNKITTVESFDAAFAVADYAMTFSAPIYQVLEIAETIGVQFPNCVSRTGELLDVQKLDLSIIAADAMTFEGLNDFLVFWKLRTGVECTISHRRSGLRDAA